jgi:hypothetical protein
MNRPKKKKVSTVETMPTDQGSTGNTGTEQATAFSDGQPPPNEPPAPVSSSPGRKERMEAASAHEDARIEYAASKMLMTEAEAQFKLALRLFDAKQRRYNNGFKRKPAPSPIGQLERGYKLQLELKDALLKRQKVDTMHEAACARETAAYATVLELQNARLRRFIRHHRLTLPKGV